jgi:hypothetical protein
MLGNGLYLVYWKPRQANPTYAHYLAAFMNTDVERVTSPDGSLVTTWLYDKDNKRLRIPIGAK